jgi:hypothetical protein
MDAFRLPAGALAVNRIGLGARYVAQPSTSPWGSARSARSSPVAMLRHRRWRS